MVFGNVTRINCENTLNAVLVHMTRSLHHLLIVLRSVTHIVHDLSVMLSSLRRVNVVFRRRLCTSVAHKSDQSPSTSSTHFGYESVGVQEKEAKVSHVFTNVASKYDQMNDAMSLLMQRHWKHYFVRRLRLESYAKCDYLDMATGTGDIGLACARRLLAGVGAATNERAPSTVTLTDINAAMLEVGKQKAAHMLTAKQTESLTWLECNAEHLPFADASFDLCTIAFGIRNCTNVDAVLADAHRVLRPGGRFVCLEFSKVQSPLFASLYQWYSFNVIPPLGHVIAGDWHSYQYLVESIRQFPDQGQFMEMMETVGFGKATVENLSNGIVAIHTGTKL